MRGRVLEFIIPKCVCQLVQLQSCSNGWQMKPSAFLGTCKEDGFILMVLNKYNKKLLFFPFFFFWHVMTAYTYWVQSDDTCIKCIIIKSEVVYNFLFLFQPMINN